jgi:hypothetical protein
MRKALIIGIAAVALALAGTAAAGPGNAAQVVRDEGCYSNPFVTTCVVTRTVTNATVTPSGKLSYVTNGTVERTQTFPFGGSFTHSDEIHLHSLLNDSVWTTSSEHYSEVEHYVSGTYELTCVSGYDIHYAGGETQFSNYELDCTVGSA